MFKKFWQKDDPLLKLFFEKYQLNLLSIPRENVKLCDIYTRNDDNKSLSTPSNLLYLLEPQFKIDDKKQQESLSDVSGTISKGSSIDSTFEFLQGFLPLLGIELGIGVNIKNVLKKNGAKSIKFNFIGAIREYVDPRLLLSELGRYHIKEYVFNDDDHSRYYVVTGIVKSSSIRIVAEDQLNNSIDVDMQALGISNTSSIISTGASSKGIITFRNSKRKLAFGIELYELEYNKVTKRLKMKLVDEAFKVRESGSENNERIHKVMKPVVISNPDDQFIKLD